MEQRSVCAIVVTFHPDIASLERLIASLIRQVDHVLVVDNGSAPNVLEGISHPDGKARVELIENGANLGIAAAQNLGIQRARDKGCSHVALFDQDSEPSSDLIAKLLKALDELARQGLNHAVVGPCIWDGRLGIATPFVHFGALGVRHFSCSADPNELVRADFLISSGMIIPMAVLDIVGPMDEALFIDNVDLEWSFRAISFGVPLFGACGVRMSHVLGDRAFRLGGVVIHRHSPVRQYYMMRNRILLYKRGYSPWKWVVQDFFRVWVKIFLFTLVFPPRLENAFMIFRGFWDGMRGHAGRLG